MNLKKLFITLGCLGVLILGACTPASPNTGATEDTAPSGDPTIVVTEIATPEPSPAATENVTQMPDELPPAVQAAQTWLSGELGVETSQIEIQQMEPVEWSDACLGLGQPNEGCMTVITPGWLILFVVNGQTYEVHTDADGSSIRMAQQAGTPGAPTDLTNTQWQLVSFGLPGEESLEALVLPDTMLTLQFMEAGQFGGMSGCNSFGGEYAVVNDNITFAEIITTEMACSPADVMEQEQQYYEALQTATNFEQTEIELKIWYGESGNVLNFVALPTLSENPSDILPQLLASQWTLMSFGEGGTENPVVEGSTLTLEFDENGQASGSGGCNQFGALYTLTGNKITFEGLTSTLIACADEAVVQQEQSYFAALQSATELDVVGDQLIILYNDGQGKLNFVRAGTAQTGEQLHISRIEMFDAKNGWAVGGTDAALPNLILQTTDGGATWVDRTPADPSAQADAPFLNPPSTYFESVQKAWVIYPDQPEQEAPTDIFVWTTQDGGVTWTQSAALDFSGSPLDYIIPTHLGFLDGQFGWLLAHLGAGMSHDYFAIFTTSDGGQTWQRIIDPNQNGELQACGKSGLVFTSPTDGWLTGHCPGLMPALFFYHTTDGGLTWTPVELPARNDLGLAGHNELGNSCGITHLQDETESLRFLLSCYDLDQNTAQGWLVTSGDEGQSWVYAPLPVADGVFHFISLEEGWLLGAEANTSDAMTIFHTLDGGQTWELMTQTPTGDQIEFVDSQNGWLVSHASETDQILFSTDGGVTWQGIAPQKVNLFH